MQTNTRLKFNAYTAAIARLSGVNSALEKFVVSPSVQQTLVGKMQQSSAFLQKINIQTVKEQQGSKLGLGIGSTIAGTQDTDAGDRVPTDPSTLDEVGYMCTQTNFDTALKYSKLDAWSHLDNFQTLVRDSIVRRQGLDRIIIGFNGTSRANTSNRTNNPLLQDVNKGWLQKYREGAPARVMTEVVADSNKVRVGAGGDYENLDALVFDAVNNLIDPVHAEDTELVVICGRAMLSDKYFPIVNKEQPNSESLAADLIISQKRIGGLPAVRVPYFPAGKILITRLDNLSIYEQEGSRRRTIIDNARRDRVENFESVNEAYVVEEYEAGCLIENIELV